MSGECAAFCRGFIEAGRLSAGLEVHKSRQGRLMPCEIGQSSFQDLSCCGRWFPTCSNVGLGYSRMFLRDKDRISLRAKPLSRWDMRE